MENINFKDETPLAITNCSVKEQQQGYGSRAGDGFEIIASPRKTTVEPSNRKFEITPDIRAELSDQPNL